MSQKRIQQIERRIDRIKRALLEIGPMRPGSLTRQYKDPQHHTGAYWQISYTVMVHNLFRRSRHAISRRVSQILSVLGDNAGETAARFGIGYRPV
jgi:hypothetical protein